ncbi:hypothetical protein TUM17565_51330 [Klebsiella pneumoniae]|nr:hypothetical protein TUM17565_51330 [Klebsiella pneumoniae]
MIHDVVTELAKQAPIKQVCQALDISRSGYYAARRRVNTPKPALLQIVGGDKLIIPFC